ncbi:MAG: squalene synthase HpnC [Zetaproteobacteria bacterium]|nr:MAG: squalene synthase HpnC [Zetaproteobacteria bacterium]
MAHDEKRLAAAYRHCQRIARTHYENFPTASLFIRRPLRPAVAAIYAFARHADDIADDERRPASVREKELNAWETLLERARSQPVDHPIMLALGDAIRRHRLPVEPLHDLLTAFRMDLTIHRYATFGDLRYYCRHSANPVGRLLLALHAIDDQEALEESDAICTALQLTNFWQDLSRDLPMGRCYLPLEWLEDEGLDHEALLAGRPDPQATGRVIERAIGETEALFGQGQRLLQRLPWRLRLQIAATLRGGRAILAATAANPDPLHRRPVLTGGVWLRMAPRILADALDSPHRR